MQTQLGKKVTNSLNKKYNTSIHVGRVGVNFLGEVSLKDIYIEDHHKDTLAFIGALNTSILDFKELQEGDLLFNDIDVDQLNLRIKNYKGENETNLDVFVAKWEKFDTIPRKGPSTFLMQANGVNITNSRVRYIDDNLETPKVVDFTKLNITGKAFEIQGANVAVNVTNANMMDFRGVPIEQLKTKFAYSLTQMKFSDLNLKTKTSNLIGHLEFNYKREDFKDFNNRVKLKANFTNSKISFTDLNKFYNEFGNDVADFSTSISGTLNNLKLINLKLKTLNNTVVNGNYNFKNLLSKKTEDFKLTAQIENLKSTYTDLKKLLPGLLGKTIPSSARNLGVFTINGQSVITTNIINAQLQINTLIGNIESDLVLSNISDIDNASYVGTTNFSKFNLGKFLDDKDLGVTSFEADVKGKGFTLNNLNTNVKGKASHFTINGYTYKNLDVLAVLKEKVFNGKLKVDDELVKLDFNGLVDMSERTKVYDFKANIQTFDLNKTNLFKRDSIAQFTGDILVKMKGSNIDNAYGEILFQNTIYANQNDVFQFKDFKITSSFDKEKVRTIAINSPEVINGTIKGRYQFKDLIDLSRNSLGSIYTNYNPIKVAENQFFEFNIKIKNKLTEIFYPDLIIHEGASLKGKISSNEKDFKLNFKSPKISFQDKHFNEVDVKLDNANPFYNAYVSINDVETDFYDVSEFELVNKTLNDTLFFRTEFKGGKYKNDIFNLNLYHTINKQSKSVVGFKKSDININDYQWFINEKQDKENKVEFDKTFKDIILKQFLITHGNEYAALSGFLKGDKNKNIKLDVKDINLSKVIPVFDDFRMNGIVNGKLNVIQEKGKYQPLAAITVDSLQVNDINLGLFSLDVVGSSDLNKYKINSSLENDKLQNLTARGDLNFKPSTPQLDLDIGLYKFDLSIFSALGDDVITNIRGLASGDVRLYGDYDNPDFKGNMFLDEAGLNIPYLNVDFDLENDARIRLNKKQFVADNIAILDTKYYTSGRLNGYVEHDAFSDWTLGLDISSDRLLVLDKEQEEESLYFGQAYIQGNAQLIGPVNELLVRVNATTKEGTVFKIPIADSETIGDNSFIREMSITDRLNQIGVDANLPEEISGLELEFDLNVTDDAEIEIVLDQEAGSVLRGRAEGLLRIEINTNDKFNMYGDCIVSEGTYNFVYGNNFLQGGFIEKKFNVKPGGTINWDGNPYQARVNIEAVYGTSANPAILLDNPSINRKIPVDVIINLNGNLMQPDVEFDIEFPNTNSVVKSELLYKLDDKEFRDRQAMALVTSGQFTTTLDLGKGAITNLVERATSLVNDLFSDEDDKLKIGLNYEQGEVNPLATDAQREGDRVGFTVSTQITDRIVLNGKVGIPVGGVSKTVVAGDVQVEFLLNEKGTLRAKIFNRENDFQALGATNEIGYTQGAGISYKVDFDTFSELLDEIFNRKKEVEEQEDEEDELDPNSFIREKSKSEKLNE
ncbi:translocation/assembly module TamB domain-containing protein [Pseudofulvibacter geojedonensis]|uniref:Translocation/assembly module TamB domain-containing protein n=1 Tax=Pseudofulvibacter geojedonensis TaxID=1123758 RepID=A0ABW3I2T2_9FLAO